MTTLTDLVQYLDDNAIEWSINANPHKGVYLSVPDYLAEKASMWNDPELKDPKLAHSETLYEARAYPSTPVGFVETRASSLLDAVRELVHALQERRS